MLAHSYGSDFKPEVLLQPEDIASVVLNALLLPRRAEVTEISIRPLPRPIDSLPTNFWVVSDSDRVVFC